MENNKSKQLNTSIQNQSTTQQQKMSVMRPVERNKK